MDRPCINCQQYFDIREHNGKCPHCKFDNFNQSTCTDNVSNKTEKINMKNFKDGQKVRHPKYGEGEIAINSTEDIYYVDFGEISRHWSKIGDEFYNQLEEVEDLPEVGEYAYFWDKGWKCCVYDKFAGVNHHYADRKYKKENSYFTYEYVSKTPPFK